MSLEGMGMRSLKRWKGLQRGVLWGVGSSQRSLIVPGIVIVMCHEWVGLGKLVMNHKIVTHARLPIHDLVLANNTRVGAYNVYHFSPYKSLNATTSGGGECQNLMTMCMCPYG